MPYLSSFVQPFIRIKLTNFFLNIYSNEKPMARQFDYTYFAFPINASALEWPT